MICYWLVMRGPFGRLINAIREDELAVSAAGKNVLLAKVGVAALSGVYVGVAGGLYATFISFIDPSSCDIAASFLLLTMFVVGGARTLAGCLIGPALLMALPQILAVMPNSLRRGRPVAADHLRRPADHLHAVPAARHRGAKAVNAPPPRHRGFGQRRPQGRLSRRRRGLEAVRRPAGTERVSFKVAHRQITCLVGPNGAGKTTVFNVITGFLRPETGSVTFRGQFLTGLPCRRIVDLGICRSFQNLRLFTELTVLDNVTVYLPSRTDENPFRPVLRPWRSIVEGRRNEAGRAILKEVGLAGRANDFVRNLSYRHGRRHRHHHGIPVRDELGLLRHYVGDIFGAPLAIEGLMAFFLEATFVGLFFFGWDKMSKLKHLLVTWLRRARLQPFGAVDFDRQRLDAVSGRRALQSRYHAHGSHRFMRRPFQPCRAGEIRSYGQRRLCHRLGFRAGDQRLVSAEGRHVEFAKRSMTVAASFGLASALVGGRARRRERLHRGANQKMKIAAIEAMWDTEPAPAGFTLFGLPDRRRIEPTSNQVPWVLGLIATRSLDKQVPGINDLVDSAEAAHPRRHDRV